MVYLSLLTNTTGKPKELKTKNIFFNIQYQELVQDKKKVRVMRHPRIKRIIVIVGQITKIARRQY